MTHIIAKEIYPPLVYAGDGLSNEWVEVKTRGVDKITVFWHLSYAQEACKNLNDPDAKVLIVERLDRLVTLKDIGDRIKRETST